ncbi:MAG: hypothetical protein IJ017_05750 [Oscillospiraceae bacterium]|nr:hypothetical protein [Oscillospiraceae bacterium]
MARINRKTFYLHYKSVMDVLDDFELHIVQGLIDIFVERGVMTSERFDVYGQIMLMDELVNENKETFEIIFPLLKAGTFLRKCGTELGKLAFDIMNERPGCFEQTVYPFTFVFTICGIANCYLDWIDFGRQFPVTELAEICERTITRPLCEILVPGKE